MAGATPPASPGPPDPNELAARIAELLPVLSKQVAGKFRGRTSNEQSIGLIGRLIGDSDQASHSLAFLAFCGALLIVISAFATLALTIVYQPKNADVLATALFSLISGALGFFVGTRTGRRTS